MIREIDQECIQIAVGAIMNAVGLKDIDTNRNLKGTPARVARSLDELTGALRDKPPDLRTFPNEEGYDQIVMSGGIQFYSLCEHHFLPFFGKAYVAYIPRDKIIGLSKLDRTVDFYAAKPTSQERLSHEVAERVFTVNPVGAACIIKGRHLCKEMRGARKPGAIMITSTMKGVFDASDPDFKAHAKEELMLLVAMCDNGV